MSKKIFPCDFTPFVCPFMEDDGSACMYFCRNNCGSGVDEASTDGRYEDEEEYAVSDPENKWW